MAGGAVPKRGIIAGINVTPLVDITLVLLIIFIVTAKMVVSSAVPMDLPQASEGQEIQVVFSVTLGAAGKAQRRRNIGGYGEELQRSQRW